MSFSQATTKLHEQMQPSSPLMVKQGGRGPGVGILLKQRRGIAFLSEEEEEEGEIALPFSH